jgi:hypothetical protein
MTPVNQNLVPDAVGGGSMAKTTHTDRSGATIFDRRRVSYPPKPPPAAARRDIGEALQSHSGRPSGSLRAPSVPPQCRGEGGEPLLQG